MGKDLYWQLPPTEKKLNDIGNIKYQVARYFDEEYDGDYCERSVDKSIIPFLLGIISCGSPEQVKDANNLISAINKYGTIILIIK